MRIDENIVDQIQQRPLLSQATAVTVVLMANAVTMGWFSIILTILITLFFDTQTLAWLGIITSVFAISVIVYGSAFGVGVLFLVTVYFFYQMMVRYRK